jgi:hypothetical protein
MIDATRTNHTLCLGLSWQKAARGGRSDFTKGGRMGPHLMEVVVEGKRTGRRPPPCWRAAPPGTTCSATSPGVCWRFASAASTSRPWSPGARLGAGQLAGLPVPHAEGKPLRAVPEYLARRTRPAPPAELC